MSKLVDLFYSKQAICLIIHTAGYNEDGTKPDNQNGILRTLAAINYIYRNKDVKYIIFSGGIEHQTFKGKYSLAKAMEEAFIENLSCNIKTNYLPYSQIEFAQLKLKEGIFKKNRELFLFQENKSFDTAENIKFSKTIANNIEMAFGEKIKLAFLSNNFHLERIKILAKQNNIENPLLIDAEKEFGIIPKHAGKSEILTRILTRMGFTKIITLEAKRQRKK